MKKHLFVLLLVVVLLSGLKIQKTFASELPFSDSNTYWPYFESVLALKESGILGGYDDGTFRGINSINRAELAKVLVLSTGVSEEEIAEAVEEYIAEVGAAEASFTDVGAWWSSEEFWYTPYVLYGKSLGWWQGYEDGSFKPENSAVVSEALKMVVESQSTTPLVAYQDEAWYQPYADLLENFQMIQTFNSSGEEYAFYTYASYGYTMKLDGAIERAELVELLYRVGEAWQEEEWQTYEDPSEMSLQAYAEKHGSTLVDESDAFSLEDPHYGFQLSHVPLGTDTAIEDLIVELDFPSGFDHGWYTRWTLQYPNGYSLFNIEIVDEESVASCYFTEEHFDFYDEFCNNLDETYFGSYNAEDLL